MKYVICDTNIFISAFNGIQNTIEQLEQIGSENILILSISVMELYRGMSKKREMIAMAKKIAYYNIIHFDEKVSLLSVLLVNKYSLSHTTFKFRMLLLEQLVSFTISHFLHTISKILNTSPE